MQNSTKLVKSWLKFIMFQRHWSDCSGGPSQHRMESGAAGKFVQLKFFIVKIMLKLSFTKTKFQNMGHLSLILIWNIVWILPCWQNSDYTNIFSSLKIFCRKGERLGTVLRESASSWPPSTPRAARFSRTFSRETARQGKWMIPAERSLGLR